MSIYELPDGFQSIESLPTNTRVNVLYDSGEIKVHSTAYIYLDPCAYRIGWSPIVPPKKKRRFVVVENAPYGGWGVMFKPNNAYVAYEIQTRESAQAVADIYEQAYEVQQ